MGWRQDSNPAIDPASVAPSIGLIETASVAVGIESCDAVLKRAEVNLVFSETVQSGKYVFLFTGPTDEVRYGLEAGMETAGGDVLDSLFVPDLFPQVSEAIAGRRAVTAGSVGVVETRTVASCVAAADVACKSASVELIEVRLANGLGGKSYLTVTGDVADVRSAVEAGADCARARGHLVADVVIPAPHPGLVPHLTD